MSLSVKWAQVVEFWIPDGLQNADTRRRAWVLVSAGLLLAPMTLSLACMRWAAGGATAEHAWLLALVSPLFLLAPVVLRVTGSLDRAGVVIPVTGFFSLAVLSLLNMGIYSEALIWLPFVPVVAGFYAGGRSGAAFTLISAAYCAVLGFLPVSGDRSDPQWFVHYSGAMGAVLFGGVLALSYERGRKRAEEEVAAAHRESTALKNEWVSVVSHELRTPLTAIKGAIGLLTGGTQGELPGQTSSLLEVAERNADRLGTLIDDLLDLQKIEAGAMTYNRQAVELVPFLKRCVSLHESFASQFGVKLRVASDSHTVEFYTDEQRLGQVTSNLVSNAIKHSESGDVVTLRSVVEGDEIRIEVSDTGAGIPEEFQPFVFEKFTQADSDDTRTLGGTGLGLSIAKRVVEGMGGSIDFDSSIQVGTTFRVALPISGVKTLRFSSGSHSAPRKVLGADTEA